MTEILPTIVMTVLCALIGGAIGYYACYRKNKAMIARIKDDNKKLKHHREVVEAMCMEFRADSDKASGKYWRLRDEYDKLLEILRAKERIIEKLRQQLMDK